MRPILLLALTTAGFALAACGSKILPGKDTGTQNPAGAAASLGQYCKNWGAPKSMGLLPALITEASEMTFPADSKKADFVYVSNLSAAPDGQTIYSSGDFAAIDLVHLATGSARALKLDLPDALQPLDVETMMTGTCGALLDGKNCLYLVETDYGVKKPRILVVPEPNRAKFQASDDKINVDVIKRILLPQDFRASAGVMIDENLILLRSPLSEAGIQKATESDLFVIALGDLNADVEQEITPKPLGFVPLALAILARLKKLDGGFNLADSENPEVAEILALLPQATRKKIVAILDGDLGSAEQALDNLNNDEGIDPNAIFEKINYKPGHSAGYLFVTGMAVSPKDPLTFIVQTLAGPIEFHYDMLRESPGYLQFASQADKRFNFIELGDDGLLAQMEAVTYVPGTSKTIWYTSERVPNYRSTAFTTEDDGSVYPRSPIMQVSCKDKD